MSKICEKCGTELKDTARVCTSCGAPAAPPEQPYLNRPVKPTPHIAEKFTSETESPDTADSAEQTPKKSTVLKAVIAVLLVLLLAAGGFFGYLSLSGKSAFEFIGSVMSDTKEQNTEKAVLMISEVEDV